MKEPEKYEISKENVSFKSGHDVLRGVLMKPQSKGPFPGVVYCHGLLSDMRELGHAPASTVKTGFAVLVFDFRGHGKSEGERGLISTERCVEDATAAFHFLAGLPNVIPERIGIVGHSFGGHVALASLARTDHFRCAVAAAPPGSIREDFNPFEKIGYCIVYYLTRPVKAIFKHAGRIPYPVGYKDILIDEKRRKKAGRVDFLQKHCPIDNYPFLMGMSSFREAEKIKKPVFILLAGKDKVCSIGGTKRIYGLLGGIRQKKIYVASGHSLFYDRSRAEVIEDVNLYLNNTL